MDYNKLKTFLTVARFGSITTAAQHLRRSQSAISQQIQLLEDELEFRLLERKNARVFLSKDGETLLESLQPNFAAIDDALLKIKNTRQNVEGHITIGELTDYGNSFELGPHLGKFAAKYPRVTFTVTKGTSPQLEQALIDNKIDMAFTVFFSKPEMFRRVFVEKTWHSLYTSRKYLDSTGGIASYKKLVECDLIDLDEKFMCLWTYVKKNSPKYAPALQHRRPNLIVNSHVASKQIVSSGFGVAVLPDYLVKDEVKKGTLVQLFPSSKKVFAGLDLAYRTNRTPRLCDQLFVKHFQTQN